MAKTGLFYSYNTKKTSHVAKKIAEVYGKDIETVNLEDIDVDTFMAYTNYILGAPTWFDGELPNYWDEFLPALEDLDFKGKNFALFGLGDQKGYPENFVDAIGILGRFFEERGGKIVGLTSTEGYTFERSKGLRGDKFMGLAIDLENQHKLTDERVQEWVDDLKKGFD
ncbi:MAG: flavodoxin [Bacteroidota bacterium]